MSSYREEEVTQNERPIPEDILQFVAEQLQELGADNLQGEAARHLHASTSLQLVTQPVSAAGQHAGVAQVCMAADPGWGWAYKLQALIAVEVCHALCVLVRPGGC